MLIDSNTLSGHPTAGDMLLFLDGYHMVIRHVGNQVEVSDKPLTGQALRDWQDDYELVYGARPVDPPIGER